MAVIDYTKSTTYARNYTWTALGASDTGGPVRLGDGWGLVSSIQAASGGGSGFNSGTMTIQVSNDGTNWVTAKDVHGTDVTFTAAGFFELSVSALYLRPSSDGSISDVDVIFNVA